MKGNPISAITLKEIGLFFYKEHATPLFCAVLVEAGCFDREILLTLSRFRSCLHRYPGMKFEL
jgi:transketolase N-terminal domain/subunit